MHRRCGSFKVIAECDEVNEMYDSELWPEGALVRRYYEPRRAVIGSSSAPAAGRLIEHAGATGTH